jgi:hypothetical protein
MLKFTLIAICMFGYSMVSFADQSDPVQPDPVQSPSPVQNPDPVQSPDQNQQEPPLEVAVVQKVVSVVNDTKSADVNVVYGQQGLTGMLIQTDKEQISYTLDQVSAGVVVYKTKGFNIISLKGTIDPRTQEGLFSMGYVTNVWSGSKKACDFLLRKDATGWYIQNAYNNMRPITTIQVLSNSSGVDDLVGICPSKRMQDLF